MTDHYPQEPKTIREFYRQILDEIELAEELGFSAFFLAEHHFLEYDIVPFCAGSVACGDRTRSKKLLRTAAGGEES